MKEEKIILHEILVGYVVKRSNKYYYKTALYEKDFLKGESISYEKAREKLILELKELHYRLSFAL